MKILKYDELCEMWITKYFLELYPNLWFWQSMSVRKNILYQYLVMVLNKHSFWLCNILRKLNSFPLYIKKKLQYYLCTHIYYISCGFFVWFLKLNIVTVSKICINTMWNIILYCKVSVMLCFNLGFLKETVKLSSENCLSIMSAVLI